MKKETMNKKEDREFVLNCFQNLTEEDQNKVILRAKELLDKQNNDKAKTN